MANHQKCRIVFVFFGDVRVLLLASGCLLFSNLYAQQPFLSFGSTTVGLGTASGIQPNYRLGEGNNFIYGTLEQQVSIKGVPFQLTGRLSNEPYLSGRASYFRFSYQARTFKRQNLDTLEAQIHNLEKEKLEKLKVVYEMEGKLSYLNYLLLEQPVLDALPIPSFPKLPNDTLPDLPDAELPQINIPSADTSLSDLAALEESVRLARIALDAKQLEVGQLDSTLLVLNKDFEDLSLQKYSDFLEGISKFDLGLSSLPTAHFSSNAIPIQGIKVRGNIQKWTYNAAAGLTVPNQIYSNQALDQVLNNSANLFNLSNFYQVNTVRFASGAALEYGEVGKNSFFVEDFYTGPSFDGFKPVSSDGSSNATNVGAYITPKFSPNITLSGTLGFSISPSDSASVSFPDRTAASAQVSYRLPRAKGEFVTKVRNIGSAYNGYAQGIYISGVRHYETSYRQSLFNRLITKVSGMRDEFLNKDSLVRVSYINQATLDLTCKVGDRSVVYGSGTLLQTDLNKAYSYQLRFGAQLEKVFKETIWTNSLESSYARILGADSNQILGQFSFKSGISRDHWGYAVKGTLQHFEGLNRIYGTNYIIQPELSYRYSKSTMSISGQYLLSEQFGRDLGMSLNWTLRPSDYFMWKLTAQRWLVSETAFFLLNSNNAYKPFYLNFQMILTLKNKRT